MSADRRSVCPKCLAAAQSGRDKAFAELGALYGKVSAEQYTQALDQARALPEIKTIEHTLKEDFYAAMDKDGYVWITYSAFCERCEFRFHFKHTDWAYKP